MAIASLMASVQPNFLVVTPCFNAASFINETIESVVSQVGHFKIRYHIQDGGSSDGTVAIVQSWQSRLENGDFKIGCSEVDLTFTSCRDEGMYDAIARAFETLGPASHDYMTWINADDRLAPGAMAIVADVFRDLPQIKLAGGRVTLIDHNGRTILSGGVAAYPRRTLAAGLHDGRFMPFIQQEGTFWHGDLWLEAGGIDRGYRLAGDWDLWRRFASVAEYFAIDAVTGNHRRHPEQLTADMAAYYLEIDSLIGEAARLRNSVHEEYLGWWRPKQINSDGKFSGYVVHRDSTGHWFASTAKLPAPARPILLPYDGSWAVQAGVDYPEGPFADAGIHTLCYWTTDQVAAIAIFSAHTQWRKISLCLRSMIPGQNLKIYLNGNLSYERNLKGIFHREEVISIDHNFVSGAYRIEIEVDRLLTTPEGRRLGVLLCDVKFDEKRLLLQELSRVLRIVISPILRLLRRN